MFGLQSPLSCVAFAFIITSKFTAAMFMCINTLGLGTSTSPGWSMFREVGRPVIAMTLKPPLDHVALTGGAFDFKGANERLSSSSLPVVKKIVMVRHGLSGWNAEKRIQGSSDLSVLSAEGALQSEKCRDALSNIYFDKCFASPISRAKSSAEIIWADRTKPLVFLDTLKEANLLFLEGMKNVDAQKQYPDIYKAWREDPVNFHIDGIYPVLDLWEQSKKAWEDIVTSPGEVFLVVSHKSILRALVSTALGMGPESK